MANNQLPALRDSMQPSAPLQDDICEPQQYCQYPNTQQIVNVISAVKLRKICVCYKLTMLNKQYYGKKQWQLH